MYDDLRIGNIAGKIGRGLAAGLIGTAAMTVSQTIEMRLCGREPSIAPAAAASRVLGVHDVMEQANEQQKQTLSQMVHVEYGTSWGVARAMLDLLGIEGIPALILQFLAVWGVALFVMPPLEGSESVTKWSPQELATSAVHHMVYTVTVDAAYEVLRHESHENPQHHFWDVFRR